MIFLNVVPRFLAGWPFSIGTTQESPSLAMENASSRNGRNSVNRGTTRVPLPYRFVLGLVTVNRPGVPLNVRPLEQRRFGRTSKAAISRQRDYGSPLPVRAGINDLGDDVPVNKHPPFVVCGCPHAHPHRRDSAESVACGTHDGRTGTKSDTLSVR